MTDQILTQAQLLEQLNPNGDTYQIDRLQFMRDVIVSFANGGAGLLPASTLPIADGVARIGVSTEYARADHEHPGGDGGTGSPTLRCFSSMDPQFGAAGDGKQAWGLITTSGTDGQGHGIVAITPVASTFSASLTANLFEQTITAGSAVFSTLARQPGAPVSITGAGLNGATLNSQIIGVRSTTQINIADPFMTAMAGSTQTVTIGSYFTPADVGKTIILPGLGGGGATLVTTIASVTDANHITISPAQSTPAANSWRSIMWGTDDTAAIASMCAAAVARGDLVGYVPNNHICPLLPMAIDYFVLRGEGSLMGNVNDKQVIPWTAAQASPPDNTLGPQHLTNCKAATNIVGVITGDSIWDPGADQLSTTKPGALFEKKLRLSNPNKPIRMFNRAIGAQTFLTLDGVPTNFPSWYTDHAHLWMGSSLATGYIFELAPNLVLVGNQNNDNIGMRVDAFYDIMAKLATFSPAVDIILATHPERTPDLTTNAAQSSNHLVSDYPAMFIRTYAKVNGVGLLDFHRQGSKALRGYDVLAMNLKSTPMSASATDARVLTFPYTGVGSTTGYGIQMTNGGTVSPTLFLSTVQEMQFAISGNTDNLFRFGYDAPGTAYGGTGNAYYQADVSVAYPGCAGPLNPRSTVSPMFASATNVTVTAGGSTVTTAATIFAVGDIGKQILVPGAGPSGRTYVGRITGFTSTTQVSVSPPTTTLLTASAQTIMWGYQGRPTPSMQAHFSITNGLKVLTCDLGVFVAGMVGSMIVVPGAAASGGNLVSYITAFTSATSVTLQDAAGTTLAAHSQVVLFGTAKVITEINVADNPATGSLNLQFSAHNDTVECWWDAAEPWTYGGPVYSGPVIRFGGPFVPSITTTVAPPGGTTYTMPGPGPLVGYHEVPMPTVPMMTGPQRQGLLAYTGIGNAAYSGGFQGDGIDHQTEMETALIFKPVMEAVSFWVGA